MPQILKDCIKDLMKKGKTKSSAFGICTDSLQKAGILKAGTQELTERGKKRQAVLAGVKAKRKR